MISKKIFRLAIAGTAVAAVCIGAGLSIIPATATASPTPHMGHYSEAAYITDAAHLPAGESAAIKRDLGLTSARYLADSAAARDAVTVVAALKAAGVHVLDSRVDGSTLTVDVKSQADVAAVVAAGARAHIGAAKNTLKSEAGKKFSTAAIISPAVPPSLYDGAGYRYNAADGNTYQCTVGFNGVNTVNNVAELVSAGHCVTKVVAGSTAGALMLTQTAPGLSGTVGKVFGQPVTSQFGNGYDDGLITVTAATPVGAVYNWGGAAAAPLASTPVPITGMSAAIVGANLCKSGSRTGWTCGPVTSVDTQVTADGSNLVNSIIASICVLPGDSGGSAVIGGSAVGITSATSNPTACSSGSFGAFFPMISTAGLASVTKSYGATWEPQIQVSTPVVLRATAGTATAAGTLTGTLSNAVASSTVKVFLDGATTAAVTAAAQNGTWTITLPALSAGSHKYSLIATWGLKQVSAPVAGVTLGGVAIHKM